MLGPIHWSPVNQHYKEILVEFGTAAIFAQQKLWDFGGYGTVSSQNDQGIRVNGRKREGKLRRNASFYWTYLMYGGEMRCNREDPDVVVYNILQGGGLGATEHPVLSSPIVMLGPIHWSPVNQHYKMVLWFSLLTLFCLCIKLLQEHRRAFSRMLIYLIVLEGTPTGTADASPQSHATDSYIGMLLQCISPPSPAPPTPQNLNQLVKIGH